MPKQGLEEDTLKNLLRRAGYKVTSARLAVLSLMQKTKHPPSAHEIIERLGKEADPVTVYRTLKHLQSSEILKQVDLRHNHAHFELIDVRDHHHIICTRCGRVENVLGCEIEVLQKMALQSAKHFSRIQQHSLEFYGMCKKCTRTKSVSTRTL